MSPPCRNERSGFKTEGFENAGAKRRVVKIPLRAQGIGGISRGDRPASGGIGCALTFFRDKNSAKQMLCAMRLYPILFSEKPLCVSADVGR